MRYLVPIIAAYSAFMVPSWAQLVAHDETTASGAVVSRDNVISTIKTTDLGNSKWAKRAIIDDRDSGRRSQLQNAINE
ncbi:uncharacterized protein PpBr36_10478 [Pyricularia pennisetigena]|uniref:uncharacterized protein n=1 Tax=Pyricularia pennisetigena TaxID=1578925 RepID=UPI00114F7326|nr:uncharacterized protein PpBr36_10478 [Pyricularia pennisetigena]TLS21159.1 hypothetical protein PpBr36_10478 [Pyricularia pennisetigena]